MRRDPAFAILVALLIAAPAEAAPPPIPSPPPAAVASRADDPLKATFEALSEPDRRAVQDALLWTGDFAGVVTGAFGARTRDALLAFARRSGMTPEAVLDGKSRALLLSSAVAARAAVGFAPLKDKQAGVTLALPIKLLPRRVPTDGGTRYASADGALVVDTLSRPAGPGGLPEVFDRMSAASGSRRVTYKLLKPDFFVIGGEFADRKFYSRFALGIVDGQSLIRGLTIAYPKADAARLDPITLAAAASFEAFASPMTIPVTQPPVKAPPAPATFTVSAIRIDRALALTHLPGKSCAKPSLDGTAVVLRRSDDVSGLALFDLPAVATEPPALTDEAALPGTSLLALFRRDAGGLDVAPAEVQSPADPSPEAFVVSAGLQGRAEGAPIIDRQGRLAGVVGMPRRAAPLVAGTQLQGDYPVVPAARLRSFLGEAGLAGTSPDAGVPKSLAAIAAAWAPRLLTIVCQAESSL